MRAKTGREDLVVWRSASGVLSAWENRCPHRGMRLSHGFVRGESLACAYHGWHFECSGRCHYIPAHPELELPRTIKPATFDVVERDGLVWVNTTEKAIPLSLPADATPLRSITFNRNLDALTDCITVTATPKLNTGCHSTTVESNQPRVLSTFLDESNHRVYLALQASEDHKTVVHALVSKEANEADRITVSRWLESLRREAESP